MKTILALFALLSLFSSLVKAQLMDEYSAEPKLLVMSLRDMQEPMASTKIGILKAYLQFSKSKKVFLIVDTQSFRDLLEHDLELKSRVQSLPPKTLWTSDKTFVFLAGESSWTRDFSPLQVKKTDGPTSYLSLKYHVSQQDPDSYEQLQAKISLFLGQKGTQTLDLTGEGGNFLSDSQGNLFVTERILKNNPQFDRQIIEEKIQKSIRPKKIVWLPDPAREIEGTGHVDMYLRILDSTHAMVTQSDNPQLNISLNEIAEKMKSLGYQVQRLQAHWTSKNPYRPAPALMSYTNLIQLGKTLIMPTYDRPQEDRAARRAYEKMGFTVKTVPAPSIYFGGSLHCLTYLYY